MSASTAPAGASPSSCAMRSDSMATASCTVTFTVPPASASSQSIAARTPAPTCSVTVQRASAAGSSTVRSASRSASDCSATGAWRVPGGTTHFCAAIISAMAASSRSTAANGAVSRRASVSATSRASRSSAPTTSAGRAAAWTRHALTSAASPFMRSSSATSAALRHTGASGSLEASAPRSATIRPCANARASRPSFPGRAVMTAVPRDRSRRRGRRGPAPRGSPAGAVRPRAKPPCPARATA